MTCTHWEERIVDRARGAAGEDEALQAHLAGCAGCTARLAREQRLTAGLRALAADTGGGPSASLERRLLASFETLHAERGAARGEWRSPVAAAAAVVVLAGGILFAWQRYERAHEAALEAVAGEFVPWPGASTLPAFESGQLVRTELPASALPILGIATPARITGTTVAADVLVGQDGLARAVRLAQ